MTDALIRLAETRTLSLLAVRFLDAALSTGRNLLFTGPKDACLPLMTALVAEAEMPALYSDSLHGAGESTHATAPKMDRMAAFQSPPEAVARALLHHVGVVAHLPASRLDRALMRLELALSGCAPSALAPLALVAALDVVVVMGYDAEGAARVRAIYEVVTGQEGYRPATLFAVGTPPILEALVPQQQPTFLAECAALGPAGESLAAEFAAAVPKSAVKLQHPAHQEPRAAAGGEMPSPSTPTMPRGGADARPKALSVQPPPVPKRPATRPLQASSAPGWELDQDDELADAGASVPILPSPSFAALMAEAALQDESVSHDSGDEPLGLEPPPRPKGG